MAEEEELTAGAGHEVTPCNYKPDSKLLIRFRMCSKFQKKLFRSTLSSEELQAHFDAFEIAQESQDS